MVVVIHIHRVKGAGPEAPLTASGLLLFPAGDLQLIADPLDAFRVFGDAFSFHLLFGREVTDKLLSTDRLVLVSQSGHSRAIVCRR